MGTIVNRNGRYRGIIRMKGAKPITKTFDRAAEAKTWVSEEESRLKHRIRDTSGMSLGDILTRYRKDVLSARGYAVVDSQYKRFAIDYSHTELKEMDTDWWIDTVSGWTNSKTGGKLKPYSRSRYLMVIKGALMTAVDLWKVKYDFDLLAEAVTKLTRQGIIDEGTARDRRVSDAEITAIKQLFKAEWKSATPLPDIIDFALCTAMRRAEILALKWADLDEQGAMLLVRDRKHPKKKIGNHSNVPLLGNALKIIQRQPRTPGEPRIFPWDQNTVTAYFMRVARKAGFKNLHFHDLRHEAISRLFEQGYGIPEVALVSGHKAWRNLQRYTHLKPESLHQGPIALRRAA